MTDGLAVKIPLEPTASKMLFFAMELDLSVLVLASSLLYTSIVYR